VPNTIIYSRELIDNRNSKVQVRRMNNMRTNNNMDNNNRIRI
jgi:hypothetical protein